QFGMGGSEALVWLSWTEWAEVWSVRDGEYQHFKVDWNQLRDSNEFPKVPTSKQPASRAPKAIRNGGTIIRVKVRDARQPWQRPAVQRQLKAIFAPAAEFGKELIWVKAGGKRESLTAAPLAPSTANSITFSVSINNDPALSVTGQVWYDEDLKGAQGVAFGYGPRVIILPGSPASRDCFSKP